MQQILMVYGSSEGQTKKVARYAADLLRKHGHVVDLVEASTLSRTQLQKNYDAAILGASIHAGRHQKSMVNFARERANWLSGMPTAFFSVSLTSATNDDEHRTLAREYVDQFIEATGWVPDRTWLVAGALPYRTYSLLKRQLLRHIVKREGGDTDTSRNYDYTDWKELERLVFEFMNDVLESHFAGTGSF